MSHLQNHGYTHRLYVRAANELTKDKAVSRVTVEVDTSRWSRRKRNIITESLKKGVAACGWETASIVEKLASTVGHHVNIVSRWRNYVEVEEVLPHKLDELLAYTAAWMRIAQASGECENRYEPYFEKQALGAIERGETPDLIPLSNSMTYAEKREFIHTYMKASEVREKHAVDHLIASIKAGETIKLIYEH
jgi:hypothetical protein